MFNIRCSEYMFSHVLIPSLTAIYVSAEDDIYANDSEESFEHTMLESLKSIVDNLETKMVKNDGEPEAHLTKTPGRDALKLKVLIISRLT